MSDFYDIHGRSITADEWSDRRNRDGDSDWSRAARKTEVGEATVSTVWLGMDHSFGSGPPLIFETLVMGGGLDQEMRRYSTLTDAHRGHDEMCRRVADEQRGFDAMCANQEFQQAVAVVVSHLTAHRDAFDISEYDTALWQRVNKAIGNGS